MLRSQQHTINDLRKEAFWGSFYSSDAADNKSLRPTWKSPSFNLVLFLSSTFTDTQRERNFLMEKLRFSLRSRAQQYGIQVIFADMRWGIRDESTLDHQTWEECAQCIHWCQEQSMGISFLSLQGDKYGYTPLPKVISKQVLDQHLFATNCPSDVVELIKTWYIVNDNALEVEYVLRRYKMIIDDPEYWPAYSKMLPALRGVPFDTDRHPGLLTGQSVSEWEVRAALSLYPEYEAREKALCWSHRQLSGEVDDRDYSDTGGDGNLKKTDLEKLKCFMNEEIPVSVVHTYKAEGLTLADLKANDSPRSQLEYLEAFQRATTSALESSLELIIDQQEQWSLDGAGLGLPGALVSEVLHHCAFAHQKCSTFIGRGALIKQVMHELVQRRVDSPGKLGGISLCIVGVSGAGKTALMAKLASESNSLAIKEHKTCDKASRVPVLIRFCGTSPGSKNARSLMVSLNAQIEYIYNLSAQKFESQTYDALVQYFHSLLKKYPVILFIDSLDQLTNENQGRSQLSFLKDVQPHIDSRIVVSCLPDEREVNPETGRAYMYLCETRLKESNVPRVEVKMSEEGGVDEAMDILTSLLHRNGRRLQENQRLVVQSRIEEEKEKTALYIHLAFRVISKWDSQVDAAANLAPGGVKGLIEQLFEKLERDFGEELVRTALAFLTFSVKGVTSTEMEDLLSLHDGVLNATFQYHAPTVRRLPTHVWLRLKGALTELVMEGEHGCYQWYHRQLKETAESRYQPEKAAVHDIMARYFGDLVEETIRTERHISRQLWTLRGDPFECTSTVNLRRCCEATFHMLQSKSLWIAASKEMCNFEGICSKLRVGEGFQIIRDLVTLMNVWCTDQQVALRIDHYRRWLRRDVHFLSLNPIPRLLSSATMQPSSSLLRQDAELLWPNRKHQHNLQYSRPLGCNLRFPPLLAKLGGHGRGQVFSVCFSPDCQTVVSGSADKSVRLWDVATGEEKAKLEGHSADVTSVCFRFDGQTVVSGSSDKSVRLWDVATCEQKAKLEGHSSEVTSVCFSFDGQTVVSGSADKSVRLWDVATGEEKVKLEGHSDCVESVCISRDGQTVVSGSRDMSVRLWDVATGQEKAKLEGHSYYVNSVCFSPDNRTVASGSADSSVRLWDVVTGQEKAKLGVRSSGQVHSVCFSPDGQTVVSASRDSSIRLWDVATGEDKIKLEGHGLYPLSVCFSSDGQTVVSGSYDSSVRLWDVASGDEKVQVEGHSNFVESVCFSPDNRTVVSGSADKSVRLWDVATGEEKVKLEGHSDWVQSVCFSRDGQTVVSGSRDRSVRLWDVATGREKLKLEGHTSGVHSACFSPDGHTVVSGSDDRSVRLWDVATGEEKAKLEGHMNSVHSVCFSPDGQTIVSGGDDKSIRLWDVATGREKVKLEGHSGGQVDSVYFSADGQMLVSASFGSVRLWDVATGQEKAKLEVHGYGQVKSARLSPDNQMIVFGSNESVCLLDVATGKVRAKLEGHSGIVRSVRFSSDGRMLVSGARDSSVRLWDVAMGDGIR